MSKVSLDDMFPGTTERLLNTSSISFELKKWLIRPPRDIDGQVIPFQQQEIDDDDPKDLRS